MAQISAEELKKYHEHCKERDEIGSEINYVSDRNVDVNEFYNDYMSLYPTSFLRKKIKKTFDKIGKDKLHGNRSAV
ncbi:hypothetical protein Q6247_26325, partial [Klebsiella pneumoniae]